MNTAGKEFSYGIGELIVKGTSLTPNMSNMSCCVTSPGSLAFVGCLQCARFAAPSRASWKAEASVDALRRSEFEVGDLQGRPGNRWGLDRLERVYLDVLRGLGVSALMAPWEQQTLQALPQQDRDVSRLPGLNCQCHAMSLLQPWQISHGSILQ